MKELEVSAKTIEEATRVALEQLGVSKEKVDIIVIKKGKSGILGIGAEDARIKVILADEGVLKSEDIGHVDEIAKQVLVDLLKIMGIVASVAVTKTNDPDTPVVLNIEGDELGVLIGRRGQALSSLQYLVRLIVSEKAKKWTSINVDVDWYKKRHYDSLKDLAIFEKSIETRNNSPKFIFFEGPPTANGNPGIHHVLSRVYKDVIPRYKTMKGYCVPRKAGWDTHGLPVELEVEKMLGFTGKAQIESYGVAKFNNLCRDSVFKYLKQWNALTERIGFWLDMDHPYVTLDNSYIESCWWAIKQLWDKGLIYQGYKVTPHCPRCGTSLSSHEVALGYKDDAVDPSVYIKFRVHSVPSRLADNQIAGFSLKKAISEGKVYFLAWTTTPWTLPGNTSLALAPDADYSLIEYKDEYLIFARALMEQVGLTDGRVIVSYKGSEL
ncbi:MAG: class I tRNA ligase family protein, partial [Chloroflexi bacterium]|nr:class I tRNA ligase family protein [Chloroflexota bacterium]